MMAKVASEDDAGDGGQHVRLKYVDRCTSEVAAAVISSKSSQVSPTLPTMSGKKSGIFKIRRFPCISSLPSIRRRSIGEMPRIVMY